jgi:hypothetical protein
MGRIKGYSLDMFTKKGRAEKQLLVRQKKGKRQPAREKAPQKKKELLSPAPGDDADGRNEGDDDVDRLRTSRADHKSM